MGGCELGENYGGEKCDSEKCNVLWCLLWCLFGGVGVDYWPNIGEIENFNKKNFKFKF